MRISDWSSDVCSSDLGGAEICDTLADQFLIGAMPRADHTIGHDRREQGLYPGQKGDGECRWQDRIDLGERDFRERWHRQTRRNIGKARTDGVYRRSEEHTSELQSLMRISYAVFCLKK